MFVFMLGTIKGLVQGFSRTWKWTEVGVKMSRCLQSPVGGLGWDRLSLEWSQALKAAHPNTCWDDFSGSLRCQGILSNQSDSVRLFLDGNGFCPQVAHCHAYVSGFYGQLQTFCPPHYPDSQRTLPPSSSCSMVPAFEDCLVPTSMGQTGFDVFHRAFSTHSGITGGCLWLGQHEDKPGAFPVAARDSVEFSRTSRLHLLPWLSPLCPPAQGPVFLPQAAAVPARVPCQFTLSPVPFYPFGIAC